jgi:hypothetical protein
MIEWKTEELDISELASVRGGYLSEVLLNPQPLPPRATRYRATLNPQPEPPGILFSPGMSL